MANEKIILDIDINVSRSIQQMEQLKAEIKEQQVLMAKLAKETGIESEEYKKAASTAYGMKEQLKILNQTTQQAVKQVTAQEGSMKSLCLQLAKNKGAYRNLSEAERNDVNIGGKLLAQIQQQDEQVKKLDASMGNYQRNVGNYPKIFDLATMSLGEMKQAFTELKNTSFAGKTEEEIAALKQRIGDLKDAMGDMQSEMKVMGTENAAVLVGGLQLISAGVEGVVGTLSLFGVESKVIQDLEKKMVQLIAVTQALGVIEDEITSGKARAILLRTRAMILTGVETVKNWANVVSINAQTAAEEAKATMTGKASLITKAAAAVQWLWNAALAANPIGLVIAGVAALAAGVGALIYVMSDNTDEIERQTEAYNKLNSASKIDISLNELSLKVLQARGLKGAELIEKELEYANKRKNNIQQELDALDKITEKTEEQSESYKSLTDEAIKNGDDIIVLKAQLESELSKENQEGIDKRSEQNRKAAEKKQKRLEELERLRIELMAEGIEKEKAAEELRYKNYIKEWGYSAEAYALHMQKMAAIDDAYRQAEEKKEAEAKEKEQKERDAENKKLDEDLDKIQKENEERDQREAAWKEQQRKEDQAKTMEQLAMVQSYSEELTAIATGAIDENGLNLKKFGKSLSLFMLDVLKKQAEAAIGAAVAGSFATPQSVATGGAAGFVQAGILTALIEAAYGVAKAIISREPQGLATGTPKVTQAGTFTVGEKGKEQVILPAGAAVIPNSLMDFAPFLSNTAQAADTTAMMIKAIQNIRPYVTVEDINAAQVSEAGRVKLGKI